MSELISGKEALIALANGEEVQHYNKKMATFGSIVKDHDWGGCDELTISDFNSDKWSFRRKPKTFMLNGIKVPKPNKPESCYSINGSVIIVMDDDDKAVELCKAIRRILTD